MDMELHQLLVEHAKVMSDRPFLRGMADAGHKITFCGVSLDVIDPSEARDAASDEEGDDGGRKLRITYAYVAGEAFLKVKSDHKVNDGESVEDAVARIFGGK